MKDGETNLLGEVVDKVEEYFKLKGVLRTLRADLKDIQAQDEYYTELEKIMKRAKELREKIAGNEDIMNLKEKIQTTKERQDLLKELIRIELLEEGKEEVEKDDRKLKLLYILKELKNENRGKKHEPHPDQMQFNA